MIDKYTKITYQSNPIGKEQIILYLTTFDIEAFEKDQSLEKIPTKKIAKVIEIEKADINKPYFIEFINDRLEHIVDETYEKQLKEMASYIETLRKIKIVPQLYDKSEV